MPAFLETYSIISLVGVALAAFVTSTVHGATGVAGGFLLSAALAPIIGVAPIVPVVSISLLVSHTARALLNLGDFHMRAFWLVSVPAVPLIAFMASIYGKMSSSLIALVLGCVILASIPLRRWAKSRQIQTSAPALAGIGGVYGALSGVSIGPGMLLVPFLLGFGLTKEQFVATLAVIALLTNVTRVSVFGATDLLSFDFMLIGLLCGLMTIPGNWIGRTVLRRMTTESHSGLVDVLTILGALNFFWLSLR